MQPFGLRRCWENCPPEALERFELSGIEQPLLDKKVNQFVKGAFQNTIFRPTFKRNAWKKKHHQLHEKNQGRHHLPCLRCLGTCGASGMPFGRVFLDG